MKRANKVKVCIYLSGVDSEKVIKLLGIHECSSGKGVDEFELVWDDMVNWEMRKLVIGMLFDTTNSNSRSTAGPAGTWRLGLTLWLSCLVHIAELHVGTATKDICWQTKDPGMFLFWQLRDH